MRLVPQMRVTLSPLTEAAMEGPSVMLGATGDVVNKMYKNKTQICKHTNASIYNITENPHKHTPKSVIMIYVAANQGNIYMLNIHSTVMYTHPYKCIHVGDCTCRPVFLQEMWFIAF